MSFDMNHLFESFVTQALRERTPPLVSVDAQIPIPLDVAATVPMRPDVIVCRSGAPLPVADCKYKRLVAGTDRQQDLYQVLAYCAALCLKHGLLIYPQHQTPIDRSPCAAPARHLTPCPST